MRTLIVLAVLLPAAAAIFFGGGGGGGDCCCCSPCGGRKKRETSPNKDISTAMTEADDLCPRREWFSAIETNMIAGQLNASKLAIAAAMRELYNDDLFVTCSATPFTYRSDARKFCAVPSEGIYCFVLAFGE